MKLNVRDIKSLFSSIPMIQSITKNALNPRNSILLIKCDFPSKINAKEVETDRERT